MELKKIFEEINQNKEIVDSLLASKLGSEFEQRVVSLLVKDSSYISLPPSELKKLKCFKELKNKILMPSKEQADKPVYIKELESLSKSPRVVFQAFGEKSAPDILLIKNGKVLSLELKFSENDSKVPVWNSGLTRPDMLYMFGSYKKKEIVFFKGSSLITLEEYWNFKNWADSLKKESKKPGDNKAKNFKFYMRSMFNQKGDMFKSEERKEREEVAINFAMFF